MIGIQQKILVALNSSYFIFILAGVIGGLAFIHQWTAWLIFPYAILFLYGISHVKSLKKVLIGSYISGIIKAGIAISWLFYAFPFDWFTDALLYMQFIFLTFCWLGTALSIGLGSTVAGAISFFTRKYKMVQRIVLPFVFVIADVAGAFFFSVYTLGPGNSLNTHFGFAMSGYALADHTLLKYFAMYGGVLALSIILGICAQVALILVLKQKNTQMKIGAVSFLIGIYIVTSTVTLSNDFKSPSLYTLATIETKFPATLKMESKDLAVRQHELLAGVTTALSHNADIVLLPEDARLSVNKNRELLLSELQALPHTSGAQIIDSARIPVTNEYTVQRSYAYDLDESKIYSSEKQYMVPLGEYLPYIHNYVLTLMGKNHLFEGFKNKSTLHEISHTAPKNIPNIIFCFESSSPWIAYKKSSNRPSDIIVHPVSHGWFRSPKILWNQERQVLITQALFTNTPILQAGNLAPNILYLPNGTVSESTLIYENNLHAVHIFEY